MPIATGTIAVLDGSTTPASVTYSLEERDNGAVIYVDRRLAARDLQPEIRSAFKRPSTKARTYNRTVEVRMPVVRVVNGVDTVVDVNKVFVTHVIAKTATEQERKHLDAASRNVLDLALLTDQVKLLESWN